MKHKEEVSLEYDLSIGAAREMERMGSGFEKALGTLLFKADYPNRMKIQEAWPEEYWRFVAWSIDAAMRTDRKDSAMPPRIMGILFQEGLERPSDP
ncbi:MAG: hypothetical protein JW839_02100 [Candidatus Lokiarchaeota archaeon]|nr:hypothetical protein [Candidatus Lokiarchaeota archaeon]